MAFETPTDITNNTGLISDPVGFAQERGAASWLYLNGEEFAEMEGGMSYADVQAAVPESANVISDPPREMTMELARQHVAALDELPRPTLVTCRRGPRSSAVIYLYAGLQQGSTPDEVISRAEADGAAFLADPNLTAWITQGLDELA